MKDLIAISPQHFNALNLDNIATAKGADAIRDYTKALEKKLKVQASEETIVGNNKRVQDIKSGALDDEFKPGTFDRAKLFFEDSGFNETKFKKETEKRKQAAIKALEEENQALLKVAAEGEQARTAPAAKPAAVAKTKLDKSAKEEKEVRIKTFAEELEEKKQMYEIYQRWVDNFGKDAADKQFNELISRNKTYVDFLNSKIDEITSANASGKFSSEESKNVDLVITEKAAAKGGKSAIDQYADKLEEAREKTQSLTEWLVYLKGAQEDLNSQAPTSLGREQIKLVTEASLAVKKQLKQELNQYLVGVAGSEAKKLEIQNHYADLRKSLDEKFNGERTEEYKLALEQMARDEAQEFQDQKDRIHEQSKEFKALSKVISETGRDGIKINIGREEDELANIGRIYGTLSNEYAQQVEKIKLLNKDLADSGIKNFETWGMMVSILAETLSEIPGGLGKIGAALSGVTSGLSAMSKAMERTKDGKVGMDQYAAAAQGVATIIGIIASSAKQRKQAESEYYQSVISQQSQYNILLNEQIGLQAEASKSVFYNNYEKIISGGVDKMEDAQEGFEKSLDNLVNGKAKNGQKNGIDWKAVGAGAAAGATVGGIAGAGVFSIPAAAIGAIGGAIAGLFGGLKKKDTFTPLLTAWPGLIDASKEGVDSFNVALAQSLIDTNQVDEATKQVLQTTIDWVNQVKEAQAQIKSVISDLAGALGDSLRENLVQAFEDGTDAAEAFGKSVEDILENILEKMIFAKVMGPALDKLEADMDASMGEKGDKNWLDDFGRFFQTQAELGNDYFKSLEDAKAEASKYGLTLWEGDKANGGSAPMAQQGIASSMTQETAGILSGQFNAMRISFINLETISQSSYGVHVQSLQALNSIQRNTYELYAVRSELATISRLLSNDFLRAIGG